MKTIRLSIMLLVLFSTTKSYCIPMQYTFEGYVNTTFEYGDPLPLNPGDNVEYKFLLDLDLYDAQFVSGPLLGNYGNTTILEQDYNSSENGFIFNNDGNKLYVDAGVQGGNPIAVIDWDIGNVSLVADWNNNFGGSGFEATITLTNISAVLEPGTWLLLGTGLLGIGIARLKKV